MDNKTRRRNKVDDETLNQIRNMIESLQFGSLTIKVHEGEIVQVEVTEKRRFDDSSRFEDGGGI